MHNMTKVVKATLIVFQPICKYTPVCICVRMRHLLTPSKICTPEYIYTCVFLAHANWTLVKEFDRFLEVLL